MAHKWKEMILGGKLSGAAKDKLLKKYVDPERMIAGLNRGSENIIERYDINVERSSRGNRIKRAPLYPKGRSLPSAPYVALPDTREIYLPKGFWYNHLPSILSDNSIPIKYRRVSSMPNRYLDELAKRHEVDEVRVGIKILDKMWASPTGNIKVWCPNKRIGHVSPEVVARESEHVAFAPKVVRERMKKIRNRTRETRFLDSVGIGYGQTTLRGAQRRKAIKRLISNQRLINGP